MEMQ